MSKIKHFGCVPLPYFNLKNRAIPICRMKIENINLFGFPYNLFPIFILYTYIFFYILDIQLFIDFSKYYCTKCFIQLFTP